MLSYQITFNFSHFQLLQKKCQDYGVWGLGSICTDCDPQVPHCPVRVHASVGAGNTEWEPAYEPPECWEHQTEFSESNVGCEYLDNGLTELAACDEWCVRAVLTACFHKYTHASVTVCGDLGASIPYVHLHSQSNSLCTHISLGSRWESVFR